MQGRSPATSQSTDAPASQCGLLRAHWWFVGLVLGSLLVSRIGLVVWQRDRVGGGGDVGRILLGGLRMDLIVACYLVAPAVLLTLLTAGRGSLGRISNQLTRAYLAAVTTAILFMEFATPAFVQEYDTRPNRLFVEYLVHPREVSSMLWKGHRFEVVLTSVLGAIVMVLAWKLYGRPMREQRSTSWWKRPLMFVWIAPLLFLGARSSTKHRPANPSTVAFSNDHLLNDLCLSSMYSVLYACYQIKDEADAAAIYGELASTDAVVDEVRAHMDTVAADAFLSSEIPTLHKHEASATPARPLNLVVILEESMGAQFVGALGGRPVTQFLDTLSEDGWWFDAMYATGTRSVRGIEAVVSGFLPTPARSVVKLGRSQQGFFTIADLLKRQGYHTQFVYGGEAHFDNMRRFFTGNGFDEIVEEKDYESPIFQGSWGVCDQDILRRAHEGFVELGEKPFFSLVFSVSNHSPWEYPEADFEPFNEPAGTPENTVRYADHALEEFFALAREAPYWENTVFLVIADHDSRVNGASLVPIRHFHIPAVILAPGLEARRDPRVVSQFDMPPTLLSLMGVSSEHPMVGHDMTRLPEDHPGRAIMQYGPNQAYMTGDRVLILQPELPPSEYRYEDGTLVTVAETNPELVHCALAHALLPSFVYREQRYRLPPQQ